jgi:Leucine-rich repeat (LRR) protein
MKDRLVHDKQNNFAMRLFSALILSFLYVGISAQNTYVPDDSFEQYLIWLEIDDVLDDSVLTANIVDVQSLHLGYSSIHDLTGLEGFLSLDTLSISELQNSDISYLDMSLVPWLTYLDCYNQNGQIDSINLSQNTDLKFLDVSGNSITSLDLSNNTMLEYLTCNFNQISDIDLSNNLLLRDIWLNSNNLTILDLTVNDSLISLRCSLNDITELDLSNKPNLSTVFCNDNSISVLNINNAPELSSLWCSGNQISELDVLNKPNLEQLFAGDNLLSSLDLSSCGSLIWIWLYSNQLFELNVANGLNAYMAGFPGGGIEYIPDFTDNPDLTCITVDDVAHSTEWWNTEGYPIFNNPNGYVSIDSTMYFSSNCSSVFVDVLNPLSVLIYPNPSASHITVDLGDLTGLKTTMKMYDASGKLVFETLSGSSTTIDVSDFTTGIYTLELSTSDNVMRSQIVVD